MDFVEDEFMILVVYFSCQYIPTFKISKVKGFRSIVPIIHEETTQS